MEDRHPQRVDGALMPDGGGPGHVGVGVVGVAEGVGIIEIEDRLGDTEEQDADTDAGGEQHREPGEVAELRSAVVGAQADAAVATADDKGADHQQGDHGHQVVAAEGALDPGACGAEDHGGGVGTETGEQYEEQDQRP